MIQMTVITLPDQPYVKIETDEILIRDAQSALDLIASVRMQTDCDRVAIPREAFESSFFRLSTGLAGEVLQKFVNYRMKLSIFGDFSREKSKPQMDFIKETNRGNQIFFVSTAEEAGLRLCAG